MIGECDLSERRACSLVGLSRDSYRNPPEADAMTQELSSKIVEIARSRMHVGASAIEGGQEIYGDVRRMGKGFALPALRVMDAQRKAAAQTSSGFMWASMWDKIPKSI
jgi:hypothetical protein